MNKPVSIDLFVEDSAHEKFVKAMIERLARERQKNVAVQVRSARGGYPRALHELKTYQERVLQGHGGLILPDLLVAVIDANCKRFAAVKSAIENDILPGFADRTIVACPDPHVEVWYLCDKSAFQKAVGVTPTMKKGKCQRHYYKGVLAQAVTAAGHPPMLGGIEFAREIVECMDLYPAGKTEQSLKHFLDDLQRKLSSF